MVAVRRMKRMRHFAVELFRRKVVRVLGAYIAVFWLLATGFASLFPTLGFPAWVLPAFVVTGIAAIPLVAFVSWKYDWVPPQLVRDPKDVELANPALSWALPRHDNHNAGYVLLKWSTDGSASNERRFFKPVSIGRDPTNDIELADPRVSRHHAVIWAEDGVWRLRDLGSTNGTFINQSRVLEATTLPSFCELRFHPQGPLVEVVIATTHKTLVSP